MLLLARVADRLYWGARYIERAEDTARIIGAFNDLIIDLPISADSRWAPLLTITGSTMTVDSETADGGENAIIRNLLADRSNPGSIASCVDASRSNLRSAREVMPREAWRTVNSLSQFVDSVADGSVHRGRRGLFVTRVVDDSRRLDGVLESTMTRNDAHRMWRLGRLIERADMTTRVLGVAAAALLQRDRDGNGLIHDEVQWMGVLRSLSALQMYQLRTRGPIEAKSVVDFLLSYTPFPRSVMGCLEEVRVVLSELPESGDVVAVLDSAERLVAGAAPDVTDGAALDQSMDAVQVAIQATGDAITARFVESAS